MVVQGPLSSNADEISAHLDNPPQTFLRGYPQNPGQREKERQKAIKRQIAKRKQRLNQIAPRETTGQGEEKAPMDKIANMLSYKEEAVAIQIFLILLIYGLQSIFGVPYKLQEKEYNDALEHDKNVTNPEDKIAYDESNAPDIFDIGPDGEFILGPDGKRRQLHGDEITRAKIRANGYLPRPSWDEANWIHYCRFIKEMYGSSHLSQEQKELLFDLYDNKGKKNKHDKEEPGLGDYQYQNRGALRPRAGG